jgi:hypothetical protein
VVRPNQVLLADELVEASRAHPRRQRLISRDHRLVGSRKEGLLRHQVTIEAGRNIFR